MEPRPRPRGPKGREPLLPYNFLEVSLVTLSIAALSLAWPLGLGELVVGTHDGTEAAAADPDESLPSDVLLSLELPDASLTALGHPRPQTIACMSAVQEEIVRLAAQGVDVGFCLRDLDGNEFVAYQANRDFYTASSIKGPYVASLLERRVDGGDLPLGDVASRVRSIVLYSDNDAYASLVDQYGEEGFAGWLEEAGVDTGVYDDLGAYAETKYPRSTPSQLADEWEGIHAYLDHRTKASELLADLFEERETSPIRDALGSDARSWSKAGWFPTRESDLVTPAANDAGIVLHQNGSGYVLAVMSTSPADLDALEGVIRTLDELSLSL
nr:serine hydrolase [uncultured Olsenella sp.]